MPYTSAASAMPTPYETGERRPFDLPVNLLTRPDRSVICYAESVVTFGTAAFSAFVGAVRHEAI